MTSPNVTLWCSGPGLTLPSKRCEKPGLLRHSRVVVIDADVNLRPPGIVARSTSGSVLQVSSRTAPAGVSEKDRPRSGGTFIIEPQPSVDRHRHGFGRS